MLSNPNSATSKSPDRDHGRYFDSTVRLLQGQGIPATKISGLYKPGADLSVPVLGRDLEVEVKCRADGFRELYSWLDSRDVLIVKADRREPLVVVRLSLAAEGISQSIALQMDSNNREQFCAAR